MSVFEEILILLAVAVLTVAVFRRLQLPPLLAYLFVGVLVGPHALAWIPDDDSIRLLAGFGVVFLLFTIGLEFSLPQLMAMRNVLLRLGAAQVGLTTALIALAAATWGLPFAAAIAVGAVLAQSSSAIIMRQLAEQGEQRSRHGQLAIGVSLFQDFTAIPFLIILPAMADGIGPEVAFPLALALLKGLVAFAVMLGVGRWLLRPLFHEIASARSAELFTLTALLVALTAAWATQALGLSLALGAFLAGMMLSETEYRHQIEADIRPFRDVLLGAFFITMGMLLDLGSLPALWHWALLLALATLALKAALIAALALFWGTELITALRAGLVLAVGGEFGFALLAIALDNRLLSDTQAQTLLAAALFSIGLGPLIIRCNGPIAKLCSRFSATSTEQSERQRELAGMSQHVLICGFGRTGQSIGHVLEEEGFEYAALDLDPVRVRRARLAGEPVLFGDSSRREMLEAAGLARARLLVITYDDVPATLKVLRLRRELRPDLPVLVRTRDEARLEVFQQAGATEVVPESLEAGLMLMSHLLLALGLPMSRVVRRVREARSNRYRLLRSFFHGVEPFFSSAQERHRERLQTLTVTYSSYAVGRSLAELQLERMRVLVTAIRRAGIRGARPQPETQLRPGDVLVLYGKPEDLERAARLLEKGPRVDP